MIEDWESVRADWRRGIYEQADAEDRRPLRNTEARRCNTPGCDVILTTEHERRTGTCEECSDYADGRTVDSFGRRGW